MILIWTLEKNIGIKDNCWLARSRGAFLGVSYFIPGKKNIGIIHNCWLARSRGAFLEVSHFIPGKKILVLNMIDGSLAQGVPFGRFQTLYLVNKTWRINTLYLEKKLKSWSHGVKKSYDSWLKTLYRVEFTLSQNHGRKMWQVY